MNRRPGLHPADVEKLMLQLDGLVDAGNTVIVVEHDMRVVAGSDWVIDIGPGRRRCRRPHRRGRYAGRHRRIRASSRTAPYLARFLRDDRGSAGGASNGVYDRKENRRES